LIVLFAAATAAFPGAEPARPVDGIMDNSFLVEEAYNQEAGVVQHIFNVVYGVDRVQDAQRHMLNLAFTQEWPVFSQKHQFSYTVPYGFVADRGQAAHGLGDVLLNYRFQAYLNETSLTAFAPRFSLVLPTGQDNRGFGNGTLGYQANLPYSTTLTDCWFVHANAGLTFLPNVGARPSHDLVDYNLGASAIYAANERFHLMLEWLGVWSESVAAGGGTQRGFASLIAPGARYAFNLKHGSQFVLGLGVPMRLTGRAADLGVFLYASFEHKLH
jgi:hypothetical protein